MTTVLPPPLAVAPDRVLPDSGDDAAWTVAKFAEIAGLLPGDVWDEGWVSAELVSAPATAADLVDTYGTADPDVLRAGFAPAEDVALAERLAGGTQAVNV